MFVCERASPASLGENAIRIWFLSVGFDHLSFRDRSLVKDEQIFSYLPTRDARVLSFGSRISSRELE